MIEEYEIEIYLTDSGKEPFNIWLASLKDKTAKSTIFLRIQRIRLGNFGDCRTLKDGLHELILRRRILKNVRPSWRIIRGQKNDKKNEKIYRTSR